MGCKFFLRGQKNRREMFVSWFLYRIGAHFWFVRRYMRGAIFV